MDSPYHIFVAQPNAGSLMPCCVQGLGSVSAGKHKTRLQLSSFGALVHNFNMLWCEALNGREEHGFTHFAMLHSDVQASPGWGDALIEEMDRVDAEVMSAVVAIKDGRGLTTTGVRYPGVHGTRRFTMTEVMGLPETFSMADVGGPGYLAINTGCWICRITSPWVDEFPGFSNEYRLVREQGGRVVPIFDSEDWRFSQWLAEHDVPTFATRKVQTAHAGIFMYPNTHVWGSDPTDRQAPPRPLDERMKSLPPPGITIETEKPVAVDSYDHTHPLGTINDNSTSPAFLKKLFELIPAEEVRLLDLGCSGGGLVRSVLEAGGFAVGVEGSDISKNIRRAEWATIPDYLFTADCTEPFQLRNGKPLKFNVVTGWEFLEHIPEDKIEAVVANIKRHSEPNAMFLGSISSQVEPHHATARPQHWWLTRLAHEGIFSQQWLRDHFGADMVRGSNEEDAVSFTFAGQIEP